MEFGIVFFECLIIKLLTIIGDNNMEKSKSTYDEFLEEVFDFALCDVCQGFYLHLFSKVVYSNNEKISLTCY